MKVYFNKGVGMVSSLTTSRLNIQEVPDDMGQAKKERLCAQLPELLTPAVVENLPPYFHSIHSQADALTWLERMVSESRLFLVKKMGQDALIGLLFAYVSDDDEAHIGYLLGEPYWGQGFATELLRGFIEDVAQTENWTKLIGGVDRHNAASSRLLLKLGFTEQPDTDGEVVFYEYPLPRLHS